MEKIDIILQESEKAFLAESERRDNLTSKAEKYISAGAVVMGFRFIDIQGAAQITFCMILAILSFILLGVSLFFSILGMQVRQYDSYPQGKKFALGLKEDISTDMVKIEMIDMYLSAQDTNAHLNNKRAKRLSYSGIFLAIGFLLAVISYLLEKIII